MMSTTIPANTNIATLLADLLWPHLEPRLIEALKGKPQTTVTENLSDWVSKSEAMQLLNVKRTTLYTLCKTGAIKYSYSSARVKLFSRNSILAHLAKYAV